MKKSGYYRYCNDGTIFVSSGKVENSSVSVTVKGNDNAGEALSEEEGKVVYLVMPNNSTSTNYTVKIQTSEGYYEKTLILFLHQLVVQHPLREPVLEH